MSVLPENGPLETQLARSEGFANHQLRLMLPGGAVFAIDECNETRLVLHANNRRHALPRADAPAFAAALERDWWTVDEIAKAVGRSADQVIDLVDRLGLDGMIQLRKLAS